MKKKVTPSVSVCRNLVKNCGPAKIKTLPLSVRPSSKSFSGWEFLYYLPSGFSARVWAFLCSRFLFEGKVFCSVSRCGAWYCVAVPCSAPPVFPKEAAAVGPCCPVFFSLAPVGPLYVKPNYNTIR